MKRKSVILLTALLCVTMLGGCSSSLSADRNTVKLDKKGRVQEVCVEEFSADYYDAEELSSYIQSAVDDYTSVAGEKTVEIKESKVEEGVAYLSLSYDSVSTFAEFNDEECFSGTVAQAKEAGYDFDTDFYDLSATTDAEYPVVSGEDVLAQEELKVFLIHENVDVIVPGTICYVSTDKTSVTDKDTVSVEPKENDTDESTFVYVVYK